VFVDFIDYGFAHEPAGIYIVAGGRRTLGEHNRSNRGNRTDRALSPRLPVPDAWTSGDARPAQHRGAATTRALRGRHHPAPADEDATLTSEEDRTQIEARLRALGYVE
jgi:hypothetical protein